MKISLSWLKELVDYQLSPVELASRLSLISIGVKQQTEDYLELDLTYNRGDLLSMRGLAYEVSAITNSPLRFLAPPPADFIWVGQNLPKTPIEITDFNLSVVQCIAKIEGLRVGPSPREWVKKLEECGMRSVNNIVDVTNLIMLEFGQPFHAFSRETVEDETIIVRVAKPDEEIITLDGKARKLTTQDIVLADTKKALDVAGVMGSKESEVGESTNTILLSASMFNPVMVRKTSKRLGLYSEASKRFQHGLSKMRLLQGLDAAIKMYQQLGGKLTAINFAGDFNQNRKVIKTTLEKINNLLGINLDEDTTIECLKKLNFTVNRTDQKNLEVVPPYFRMDINIEEDVIEEIARIYGYEKLSNKPLSPDKPIKINQALPEFIYDLKVKLSNLGLTEIQTYSFHSTNVWQNLGWDKQSGKLISIANPISKETKYLRVDLWPNLLEVINKNLREGLKNMAIFEIGKVYIQRMELAHLPQKRDLPKEPYRISIALCNGTDNPLQELYQITQNLRLHPKGVKLNLGQAPSAIAHFFHPNRFINIERDGRQIGVLAEIHLGVLNKFGIEKRVAVLELDVDSLI